jgi:hypothetical protein
MHRPAWMRAGHPPYPTTAPNIAPHTHTTARRHPLPSVPHQDSMWLLNAMPPRRRRLRCAGHQCIASHGRARARPPAHLHRRGAHAATGSQHQHRLPRLQPGPAPARARAVSGTGGPAGLGPCLGLHQPSKRACASPPPHQSSHPTLQRALPPMLLCLLTACASARSQRQWAWRLRPPGPGPPGVLTCA